MSRIVWKVVRSHPGAIILGQPKAFYSIYALRSASVSYHLGRMTTVPPKLKTSLLFAFKTHQHAEDWMLSRFVRLPKQVEGDIVAEVYLLRCQAWGIRPLETCQLGPLTVNGVAQFWAGGTAPGTTRMETPAGTIGCRWIKPLAIEGVYGRL